MEMTLDFAQEQFRDSPSLASALAYVDAARGYFADEMIEWETADAAFTEAAPKIIGSRMRFAYPVAYTTLPDYSDHRDQIVTVMGLANDCDPECAPMFKIKADDGWTGSACREELQIVRTGDSRAT